MPKLTAKNPAYRRHRASGQAIVKLDGHYHYLGPWKSKASRLEYDRVIGEWLASGRRSAAPGPDLTVTELIERFWVHVEKHYRHPDGTPTSEVKNFKSVLAVLKRLYGATLAAEFGPLALDAVRGEMIRIDWCRGNVNHQTGRVKLLFKWATAKELVPPSIHHALTAVSGLRAGRSEARESKPVAPVDDAVVAATLPHLSSVVAGMVQIQRLTGARGGEICQMTTGGIDRTGDVWTYAPSEHKTAHHGHKRIIHLGAKAQAIIKPYLKPLNPAAYIFSPRDAVMEMRQRRTEERIRLAAIGEATPLSCGNRPGSNRKRKPKKQPGQYYTSPAYAKAIKFACIAAGVSHWHPHQLRHTAATEIRRQFGIEAAQTILGHNTLSASLMYAEKNIDASRKIAAMIG